MHLNVNHLNLCIATIKKLPVFNLFQAAMASHLSAHSVQALAQC